MDQLEKDFQHVLNELVSDKSLQKFRVEYEKLHSALQQSHSNEKKLMIKCRELNQELITNASKVGTAIKLSADDQNNVALLKNEIDKAWKMVDVAQDKEKKAKRTIQELRSEIQNLTKLMEKGAGLNIGQEATVNELLRNKEEMRKELDNNSRKMEMLKTEIKELNEELVANEENKSKFENKIKALNKKLCKAKQDLSRACRRSQKSEKQLIEIKSHLDEEKLITTNQLQIIREKEKEILNSAHVIKIKDQQIIDVNNEFDSLKAQCQELLEQLEINKEDEMILNKDKHNLETMIQQQHNDVQKIQQELNHWRKQSDKFSKNELNLNSKLKESELQRNKLKDIIQQIKKDMLLEEKDRNDDKRMINELNLDLKKLLNSMSINKKKNECLLLEIKTLKTNNKQLTTDLNAATKKITQLSKKKLSLEKKSERLSESSNEWHSKNKQLTHEIHVLNIEQNDTNNVINEERNRLKVQQQLYENIRGERNLFCQNLNEAQDEIAEMRRKFKIMTHQIEQYKEETTNKDKAIIKQHFEIKELSETIKGLEKQKIKKDEIIQCSDKLMSSQDTEIKTLRRTLIEAETTQKSQKQVFDSVIDERDILGAQLVRRNDELALLLDKVRRMESALEKGEIQYNQKIKDCHNLKLQMKDLKTKLNIKELQNANISKLKSELHHLQRQLLDERTKVKALSEELENPINVHRWRKLSGSDPDHFESIQKIQTLQKRLIIKTEQIVEKDLIIQEKERLYVELKNILSRQPGPEVIEQLNNYQNILKHKTKQMKSNTAQLNMLQIQLNEYKNTIDLLQSELNTIKRKYYKQKKREQLWKEQSRIETITSPDVQNLVNVTNTAGDVSDKENCKTMLS